MDHRVRGIWYFLIVIFLGTTNCAKMGSLTGGLKDEDPPKVLSSSPENYSTNFESDKIEIIFDEFIQLDNVNQQLVVSPPLKKKPVVKLRNKTLLIELDEKLRDSTTYTLNFGGAIKDNNEGNPLTNYEFVFATGDYLDSLTIGGTLLNAFDLKPSEDPVMVMLYDDLSDSVVFRDIPVYIGKSAKDGSYRINNLKADTFKLFALKDVNNNFLFDQPNELIAFLDTTIIIDPDFFSKLVQAEPDSTSRDSLFNLFTDSLKTPDGWAPAELPSDTIALQVDSTVSQKKAIPDRIMVDMFLFTEKNETQFLSNHERKIRNRLNFSFNLPVSDSFHFRSLQPESENWYLEESSAQRDTFKLWIIDPEVSALDTIVLELNYVVKDSLKMDNWKNDTIRFFYREPQRPAKKRDTEEEAAALMTLNAFKNNSTIELNLKARFLSETPVNFIDTSKIEFFILKDTLETKESYAIYKDSTNLRGIVFDKEWEPGGKYHFIAYPGAFMDIYGATTDTIDAKFFIRKLDSYGILIVTAENITGPTIIQLMDQKETVLLEQIIYESGEFRFEYLKPGKYKLKMIYDRNDNGKWDTGKYIQGIQPEKVEYYKGDVEIRANWELKVNVRLAE